MSETTGENGAVTAVQPAENADAVQPQENPTQAELRQPTKMESALAMLKSLILRGIIIYFITSFFRRPAAPAANNTNAMGPVTTARNMFLNGTDLALYVYVSEDADYTSFKESDLFWFKEKLTYGDWTSGPTEDGIYTHEKELPITDHIRNNGSLYMHAYLTKFGENPDPKSRFYGRNYMSHVKKLINKYKKLKASGKKNLLTGDSDGMELEDGKIISHWHPNLTINLVVDHTVWTYGAVPQPLDEYIKFTEDAKLYKPILYANDFWNMARDYKPLNETFSLQLTFQPITLLKWQLFAAQSMRQNYFLNWGGGETEPNDEEQDTLKETLLDTNPYLLGITMVVSIVHSVFELLAFKNDIQFWNNRNSLEGLSVRSVFFSVFQSLIVLLYVLDNETNTLVRISCLVGLGIEIWKIKKVVDIKFENGWIHFKDKGSYVQSSTKQYDELAFKYLSWLCFPLLAAYSAYALLYLEHKGWYSFVLDIFYGYLLTFGFIMMTPQLFINYKLQSVAHLPWRMLTYKFLNTFIDDMFAFVIKMPTMYRIGCFRDDIIFLIFLYQKWIYPVDKSRRNEFGYVEEAKDQNKAIEGAQEPNKAIESAQEQKNHIEGAQEQKKIIEGAQEQNATVEDKKTQ